MTKTTMQPQITPAQMPFSMSVIGASMLSRVSRNSPRVELSTSGHVLSCKIVIVRFSPRQIGKVAFVRQGGFRKTTLRNRCRTRFLEVIEGR